MALIGRVFQIAKMMARKIMFCICNVLSTLACNQVRNILFAIARKPVKKVILTFTQSIIALSYTECAYH